MVSDSLHPGSGQTIGFGDLDMDNNLRMVFYVACMGWISLSFWIANLKFRLTKLESKDEEINDIG